MTWPFHTVSVKRFSTRRGSRPSGCKPQRSDNLCNVAPSRFDRLERETASSATHTSPSTPAGHPWDVHRARATRSASCAGWALLRAADLNAYPDPLFPNVETAADVFDLKPRSRLSLRCHESSLPRAGGRPRPFLASRRAPSGARLRHAARSFMRTRFAGDVRLTKWLERIRPAIASLPLVQLVV
jgi:hypothetical protein